MIDFTVAYMEKGEEALNNDHFSEFRLNTQMKRLTCTCTKPYPQFIFLFSLIKFEIIAKRYEVSFLLVQMKPKARKQENKKPKPEC